MCNLSKHIRPPASTANCCKTCIKNRINRLLKMLWKNHTQCCQNAPHNGANATPKSNLDANTRDLMFLSNLQHFVAQDELRNRINKTYVFSFNKSPDELKHVPQMTPC